MRKQILYFFITTLILTLCSCKKNKHINKVVSLDIHDTIRVKPSKIKENIYKFKYLDGSEQRINLISFNSNLIFDSIKIVRKQMRMKMLKKSRKANFILGNNSFSSYLKENNHNIYSIFLKNIKSNNSFLIDEDEYSLPIIQNNNNYNPTKYPVLVNCDVLITKLYVNNEEKNYLPIIERIREK